VCVSVYVCLTVDCCFGFSCHSAFFFALLSSVSSVSVFCVFCVRCVDWSLCLCSVCVNVCLSGVCELIFSL
jgi:hypothetical protein